MSKLALGKERKPAASMQRKIRVLVVDDSALARKLITKALEDSGDIEVAGTACDGFSACTQVAALHPDVVTLDIEMPGMNGLMFLEHCQGERWVPAVVVSSVTNADCEIALDALRAGAVEVIGKPIDKPGFLDFRAILPAKVRAAFTFRRRSSQPHTKPSLAIKLRTPGLIAIGSSTGGTEAVETILREMPDDAPGIVVAQHIPAKFSTMFAERLNQVCRIEVKEARDGDKIHPGRALIAPGDQHMVVTRRLGEIEIGINQGPRVSFQRPSIDMLFQSVASTYGPQALGTILTGMGCDGAAGLLEMKRSGAATIAQDEASCAVFGMPREAIRLGAVDHVLSLDHIAITLGNFHARRLSSAT